MSAITDPYLREQLEKRLNEVVEHSGSKLVAIGDAAQLPSIGAGGMFARLGDIAPSAELSNIRRTLDLIAGTTGVKPTGWSSPSVYSNGDTMQAAAAEGITYTLDQMDSDIVSRLKTPQGPLVLLPYPVVTVDMGQQLARMKSPTQIETLWLDYVSELANEARADPAREATTVVIGIHPFVVGTPDGAAALRRVLLRLKKDDAVWLTDTDAILKAAGS